MPHQPYLLMALGGKLFHHGNANVIRFMASLGFEDVEKLSLLFGLPARVRGSASVLICQEQDRERRLA